MGHCLHIWECIGVNLKGPEMLKCWERQEQGPKSLTDAMDMDEHQYMTTKM